MTSTKHDKGGERAADRPFPDDLERNPGIGKSKGAFATGEDPETIEGENTVDGDVQNDSGLGGGVNPNQLGRENE